MKNESSQSKSPTGEGMNRQAFLRTAVGGVGACYAAAAGYPIYRYLQSPIEKGAGAPVNEVTVPPQNKPAEGTVHMFKFGSVPAMLIHHKDGSFVALTAKCSHLGCTVQYEPGKDRIFCACHGGIYNAHTGGNVSGPPPKPLERLEVNVTDAGIVISRIKKTGAA